MSEKNPYFGSTFAERKAIREKSEGKPAAEAKQVDDESAEVEDKAVAKKATTRKTAKKS